MGFVFRVSAESVDVSISPVEIPVNGDGSKIHFRVRDHFLSFYGMLQIKIPPVLLGRMIGVSSPMMALEHPVGIAISGLFADRVGIRRRLVTSGGLSLLCGAMCGLVSAVRRVERIIPGEAT